MPRTSEMRFAVRHCFSGMMIGMPPPTLASKRKSTSCFSAMSKSSWPNCATTSLFAVTTLLPASIARSMYSFAGCRPPMTSTTTEISSSSRMSSTRSVSSMPSRYGRGFFLSRTRTFASTRCVPTRAVISSMFSFSTRTTPEPTVPEPRRPILMASFIIDTPLSLTPVRALRAA